MSNSLKNILIVTHHFPPHISGVGMVAYNQAKRLAAKGHNVTLVTSETNNKEKSSFIDNIKIIRVKALNIFEKVGVPFPLFSPELITVLLRETKKADIVHIHDVFYISSFSAAMIGHLLKKPIILTQHVSMINHPSKFVVFIQKVVYNTTGAFVFRVSNKITTYNYTVKQFLIKQKVPQHKIETLVNGVDTSFFSPAINDEKEIFREKFNLSTDKKIILFVGRFVPKKGFNKVLAIKSPEYQIVCAGGDTPKHRIDDVVFLGKLSQLEVAELYKTADIFLLPSDSEGFPLSIQEAMASGLPIITTNDEGYREYNFDPSLISLLDKPSEDSIRNAVDSIINNSKLSKKMSTYSREYAEKNFNWPRVINRLEELYDSLLIV